MIRVVDNLTGIVLKDVSIQRKMQGENRAEVVNLTDKNGVELWEGDILTDGINTFTIGYVLKQNMHNWNLVDNATNLPVRKNLIKDLIKI